MPAGSLFRFLSKNWPKLALRTEGGRFGPVWVPCFESLHLNCSRFSCLNAPRAALPLQRMTSAKRIDGRTILVRGQTFQMRWSYDKREQWMQSCFGGDPRGRGIESVAGGCCFRSCVRWRRFASFSQKVKDTMGCLSTFLCGKQSACVDKQEQEYLRLPVCRLAEWKKESSILY